MNNPTNTHCVACQKDAQKLQRIVRVPQGSDYAPTIYVCINPNCYSHIKVDKVKNWKKI